MRQLLYAIGLLLLASACNGRKSVPAYSWEEDLHQRLLTEFCLNESQVKDYIRRYIPDVTDEQMRQWEASGALECMQLDGEKRYLRNAGPNLFRIDSACRDIKQAREGQAPPQSDWLSRDNLLEILQEVRQKGTSLAAPKRMRVTYSLTVDTNAVPPGEVIRCWLPYPRTDLPRQQDVKLIATSEPAYTLAPEDNPHRTLYMEKRAVPGSPTVFSETFEYTAYGEWHPATALEAAQPYDTQSPLYQQYTAEREAHVTATPRLRELAERLTHDEPNPYRRAARIYRWINARLPHTAGRANATIPHIPEYVLRQGHGDSSQRSLLFVTLCRLSGIPARCQSGFRMTPRTPKPDTWAEIYLEGIGWLPFDLSAGLSAYAARAGEPDFYQGGIDSWRMVVSTDFGRPLMPAKQYPRSETVDFHRGEVEWSGGNLYSTQWHPHIEVEYLNY